MRGLTSWRRPSRRTLPVRRPSSKHPAQPSPAALRCWCSDGNLEAITMIIRNKPPRTLKLDEPVLHRDSHKRPVTRRDFIAQGFLTGSATVIAPTALSLLLNPGRAMALDADILAQKVACGITGGSGKIPFICFDLAGGGNIAGSNVLVGSTGGQLDFLTPSAYGKMGLPASMVPNS